MNYDFSFSNPQIKDWFDGKTDTVPVRQFVYVHEHPLIKPNFVAQMDGLIYEAGRSLVAKNIKGAPANKLVDKSKIFVKALEVFLLDKNEVNAENVLKALRDIYVLCLKIKSL